MVGGGEDILRVFQVERGYKRGYRIFPWGPSRGISKFLQHRKKKKKRGGERTDNNRAVVGGEKNVGQHKKINSSSLSLRRRVGILELRGKALRTPISEGGGEPQCLSITL